MPFADSKQPEILQISPVLRLRAFDGSGDFALSWYQDLETLRLVDGPEARPYSLEKLRRMYACLNQRGELYWIEVKTAEGFSPVGDVTLCREDLPIVVGIPEYRGRGIGYAVIQALVRRGKLLGWDHLAVGEIYGYNQASRRLFESCGFLFWKKTALGGSYRLELSKSALGD